MNTVQLKPKKAKPFWYGHPLIFSGAIETVAGDPKTGELVKVIDDQKRLIGVGVYNPHSLYRVRLLALSRENASDHDIKSIIEQRLKTALNIRNKINLPNPQTNAFRLINSEGDGLSGIIIDVYNNYLVIAPSAYWVQIHRDLIETVCRQLMPDHQIIWRPSIKVLKQDGCTDIGSNTFTENQTTLIQELGIQFNISLTHGQKTGYYCDQRDNRKLVREFAKDRKVFDLFCYTGGFSLNAALGGAASVVGIDSSLPAITLALENKKINQVGENVEFICDDVNPHLAKASDFDFVILDPPKIAPSQKHLHKAMQYYKHLNQSIIAALPSGGLLFTCTCSAAITPTLFYRLLNEAAFGAKKSITFLTMTRAAADHPIIPSMIENDYLHGVLLAIN